MCPSSGQKTAKNRPAVSGLPPTYKETDEKNRCNARYRPSDESLYKQPNFIICHGDPPSSASIVSRLSGYQDKHHKSRCKQEAEETR